MGLGANVMAMPPAQAPASGSLGLHVLAATVVLLLLTWLSTGTLTPYASTSSIPIVTKPCRYLVNCDHPHFAGTFKMIDGAPRHEWEQSVVLRRTLYPLLAYPFMKLLGFERGGLLLNVIMHVVTLLAVAFFVRRRWGPRSAAVATWLFATHPGIYYWIGLPYSYAAIVPASMLATMAVIRIDEGVTRRLACALSLAVGVLCLGSDLIVFLLPASVIVLANRTRSAPVTAAGIALLLAPSVMNLGILHAIGAPLRNGNSAIYWTILSAYLSRPRFLEWSMLLLAAPGVLLQNFLGSCFVFLPVLFVAFKVTSQWVGDACFSGAEQAVLTAVFLAWALCNLAPPYEGRWQLRGAWIARLYQPVFAILILYMARWLSTVTARPKAHRGAIAAVIVVVAAGALVVLGPWVAPGYSSRMYWAFYQQDRPDMMVQQLAKYGRRPLGFCGSVPGTGQ